MVLMLKDLNVRILKIQDNWRNMGTTFGVIICDNTLMHVGDSRAYHIGTSLKH